MRTSMQNTNLISGTDYKSRSRHENDSTIGSARTNRGFLPFHIPEIGDEEIQSVVETLTSGWLTTGPKSKQFEKDFAKYVGCQHAVAVNSGTAALHLALDAVGIQEGDDVIVPTMTFTATAELLLYSKA